MGITAFGRALVNVAQTSMTAKAGLTLMELPLLMEGNEFFCDRLSLLLRQYDIQCKGQLLP